MLTSTFPRFEGDYFGPWILEYCKELRNQGAEVFVLAPRPGDTPHTILSEPGLHIYRFDYTRPISFQQLVSPPGMIPKMKENLILATGVPGLLLQFYRHAHQIVSRFDIDIVHSQWAIPAGFIGTLISKQFNLPHFITSQGAEFYLSTYSPLNFISKWAIRRSNQVLPVSQMMRKRALRMGIPDDKITVVPNTVNINFFKPKKGNLRSSLEIGEDEFIILTIRRLVHEKRVEDVIEAFANLDQENMHLVIGGDGPEKSKLEQLCEDLNLTSKVHFLGFVDNNKLDRIYPDADVYVLSSQQEGLSLSMLESMASEVITISTSGTGGNDLIVDGQTGFLFPVGDTDRLSQIFQRIYEMGPSDRDHITKASRKIVVEQYSTSVMVQTWFDLYRNALA